MRRFGALLFILMAIAVSGGCATDPYLGMSRADFLKKTLYEQLIYDDNEVRLERAEGNAFVYQNVNKGSLYYFVNDHLVKIAPGMQQTVFQALDDQYHQGKISEAEYLEKRREIVQILLLALQANAQQPMTFQNPYQQPPSPRVSTHCTSRPYGGGFAVDCR